MIISFVNSINDYTNLSYYLDVTKVTEKKSILTYSETGSYKFRQSTNYSGKGGGYMYWLTGLLGLASLAAPYLLYYSDNTYALWTNLIFGAVLLVASLLEAFADDKDTWEYWVVGIAGVGAILAPFILGFNFLTAALWTIVAMGIISIVAAGTRIIQGGPTTRLGY